MDRVPITKEGFQQLENELRHRKSVERPAIIEAVAEARAHGDLSENAEYAAARERQSFNEGRIQELEALISQADVIDIKTLHGNTVKFGATVKLVDEESDEEAAYKIVGEPEADIQRKLVSIASPIARALIGKKVGDSVEVNTPRGARFYEVLAVEFK